MTVTACYLSRAGLRVLVLEGREIELATNDRPRLGRYVAIATAAGEIIIA